MIGSRASGNYLGVADSFALDQLVTEVPSQTNTSHERARALVNEHFDFLWRLLRRLGVPEAEVDDAAQQVFLVATRRLAEVAPTGGTFNRLNNPSYPATVSNFGLDNYEITVGRFRKFVAVYTPSMIPAGAGKNSHNPSDPGWDPSWNASLPQTTSALIALVTFPSPTSSEVSSWTDAPAGAEVENRAMNFLSWAIAEAFCIWDGGRLPTVAEWWYAAVGGSEQRVYPWGAEVPGQNTELSVFNCLYNDGAGKSSGYCKIAGLAPVGFAPAGNGKWGQSDLSGGLTEWVQDYRPLSGLHPVPCVDCANLNRQGNGKLGYGPNYDYQFAQTVSQTETSGLFNRGMFYMGARCARNAP